MTAFRRDVKRLRGSRRDPAKLEVVIERLAREKPLDPRQRDHVLTGNWNGYRECHIAPDWLLIYKIVGDELWLIRTGSHAELF